MLRITINNEEVCTDKNITINEEYLNTSNVILNDVHPKLWDLDEIYLNRFYHPKEYSKCKIFTTDDNYMKCVIQGQTSQDIMQQLFNQDDIRNLTNNQYITQIIDEDGYVHCTFDNTSGGTIYANNFTNKDENLKKAQTYTVVLEIKEVELETGQPNMYIQSTGSGTHIGQFQDNTTTYLSRLKNGMINIYNIKTKNAFTDTNTLLRTFLTLYDGCKGSITYRLSLIYYKDFRVENFNYQKYNSNDLNISPNPNNLIDYMSKTGNISEKLLSKNLYSGLNDFIGFISVNNGVVSYTNLNWKQSDFIKCNANENYTIGLYLNKDKIDFFQSQIEYSFYNNSKVWISTTQPPSGVKVNQYTITPPSNAEYMIIGYRIDLYSNHKLMINKGNNLLSYENYFEKNYSINLGDIELNGFDEEYNKQYNDVIFYNSSDSSYYDGSLEEKWYIKKYTHKITFNGEEVWVKHSTTNGDIYMITLPDVVGYTYNNNGNNIAPSYCNKFTIGGLGTFTDGTYGMYGITNSGQMRFFVGKDGEYFPTLEDWKTYLSENNLEVVYAMSTPEYVEITDKRLIQQLENYGTDLLFCGVIKNTGNINLNPRFNHFTNLQILDFKTFLSEGELSEFVIYEKTISEAIEMIINDIADYGVVLGNVNILNPDEIIGAYSTVDKSAYDVFNYFADISNSRWTTRMIDENTIAVDFYDPSLMKNGESIEYSQEYFEDKEIIDMTYSYSTNDYRNKQIITSNEIIGNILQSQTIIADGYSKNFLVEQKIGTINSLTVNGEPVSITTEDIKEMGYTTDFYYKVGNNYISTDKNIGVGSIIVIEYLPIINGRQVITEPLEISLINENTNRKGVVLRYENRNDATTSLELQKIGESYIKYKGVPEIILKVKSKQNIWNVGDKVEFTNAPLEELETYYMVKSKKVKRILPNPSTEDVIFYEYEMTSSFNAEKDINYFDNQRAKVKGNIGVGETINRNIDVENSANIVFFDSKITEVLVDGDNVLNSVLNSPFTK